MAERRPLVLIDGTPTETQIMAERRPLVLIDGIPCELPVGDTVPSVANTAEWVRPADWLPIPTIGPTEQKVIGLHAVFPHDGNFCTIKCAGAFNVDWGDGVVENFSSNATAYHTYDYNNAALAGTESEHGYKQALVVITPQSGQNLTSVDFKTRHNQSGLGLGYSSGWLDMEFGAPNCTSLSLGGTDVRHTRLARFRVVSCGLLTSMGALFSDCYVLQSVDLSALVTSSVINMSNLFLRCYSLLSLDLSSFNTSAVTNMSNMLSGCYSLRSVNLSSFNTQSVQDMYGMFSNCYSLQSLDLSSFNTAAVTNMAALLSNCYSLQSLDLSSFNTAAVTNMGSMLANCYALNSVNLSSFSTTATTNLGGMFSSCYELASIIFPANKTFSVSSLKLSSAALNALYTSLGTVTGQTITVTGNYGTAGDDPSIATAKGWTVTG